MKVNCPTCRRRLDLEIDEHGHATVQEHDNYLQTARCELSGKRVAVVAESRIDSRGAAGWDSDLLASHLGLISLLGAVNAKRRRR